MLCSRRTRFALAIAVASLCAAGLSAPSAEATVWYVDDNAIGGDGSSWAQAFSYLQDALMVASNGDEVRVAQGTYRPDERADWPPGGSGSRSATFQLINGVALLGGYAGPGEPDPDARDTNAYETILSGDLAENDGPDFANNSENSYHITTGSGTNQTAVLDGFTLTAANTNTGSWNHCGGGMRNINGSPTVNECNFVGNSARWGGGMGNYTGSPTVTNCTFSGNRLVGSPPIYPAGGGVSNMIYSSPTFTNCSFTGNSSTYLSGGMHNYRGSSPLLTNCSFIGNTSGAYAGGLGNDGRTGASSPTLINCAFSGNSAIAWGGGMWNLEHCTPTLINCTFTGNSANFGGGVSAQNSSPTLTNCVLWGDYPEEIYSAQGSNPVVTYSGVQGGWPGQGNMDGDPLFVDPDGADDIPGTLDDDLRLSADSNCIDAGDNTAVPVGITTDLDGNPRFEDDPATTDTGNGTPPIVDMGAYEFQPPPARLDIKPGSCPNSFNRNSHGVLPVSLLGSDSFDVTEVDLASIQLCRADGGGGCVAPHEGPPGPHSEFDDTGTPFDGELCDCHELTGDGITDLSMKFKTDELVAALEMDDFAPGALVELTLSGETLDGAPFEASDCVRLVPPGTPPGLLAILQPGVGQAYVEISPLDDQLDGGGFGDFERSFPQSTVSTLEAPDAAGEKQFVGWKLDGIFETTDFSFGVTVEGMSQTIEAVYRLPGDIIADDSVNLVDFAQFANCYGQNAGTASCAGEFHAASDLNRDGRVDLIDFSIFALNFGT